MRQNRKASVTLFATNKITQDMVFKQAVIEYSFKYGVTAAAIRYKTSRQIAIKCIQTDNGFEFTNEMRNSKKKTLTLFEQTLAEKEIRHKKSKPFPPRQNGKAERIHRKSNGNFIPSTAFTALKILKISLLSENAFTTISLALFLALL